MIKQLFLYLALFTASLSASDYLADSAEIRGAVFNPSSKRFREIYGRTQASYGLEVHNTWGCGWGSWVNFDWLSKKGTSTGCSRSHTRVQIASLSFGGRVFYPFTFRSFIYLGLGAVFSQVYVTNQSRHSAHAFSPGLVIKSGLNTSLCGNYYVDLFADYYFQSKVFKTHVNVDGFRGGIGVGRYF